MSLRASFCEAVSRAIRWRLPRQSALARNDRVSLVFIIIISLGLASCAPSKVDEEPMSPSILAGSLEPYFSPVPSITLPPPSPAPTQTPLPTATPRIYIIAKGDTMGSIALEFGISMEELMRVNADISPSAMSVGQELLIPDIKVTQIAPTIAPFELRLSPPYCYSTLSGGRWCFISVQNETDRSAESISAEVKLFDEKGNLLSTKTAFSLIDRLLTGETMPLSVFFPKKGERAEVTLKTALPIPTDDARYIPVTLKNTFTEISWDGRSAEVSGEVIPEGNPSHIWVLAIAYDANGHIVGVRRWESVSGEKKFNLIVASLGYMIEHVQIIVEAKR